MKQIVFTGTIQVPDEVGPQEALARVVIFVRESLALGTHAVPDADKGYKVQVPGGMVSVRVEDVGGPG